eukprot:135130_1
MRLFCYPREQWRDIVGFSRYLVSASGKVQNRKNERLISINIPRFQKTNRTVQLQLTRDDRKRVNVYLGRLVLNAFKPIENSNEMYATHTNGNIQDDNLDNLAWNNKILRSHIWNKSQWKAVRLISMSNDILEFDSILKCAQVLSSELKQSIRYQTVSKWCYEKKQMHGYKFMFVDQSKYCTEIKSFTGEKWKLFFETKTG